MEKSRREIPPAALAFDLRRSTYRMITQIIIPARLASTRLPRELLLAETGKPLIQHTYESASRAAARRHLRSDRP